MAEVEAEAKAEDKSKAPLSITIKDKAVLYAAYMHFLQMGGLFIPTKKSFELSQEISLMITLLDDKEKYPVTGKVIWVTPPGSQGNKAPGIGIQFDGKEGEVLRNKIEALLATSLKSERPTHTM